MKRAGFLAMLLLAFPVLADQVGVFRPDQIPVIDVRSAESLSENIILDYRVFEASGE